MARPSYPEHIKQQAIELHAQGHSYNDIANGLGQYHPSPATIHTWTSDARHGTRRTPGHTSTDTITRVLNLINVDGMSNAAAARQVSTTTISVRAWRQRYLTDRDIPAGVPVSAEYVAMVRMEGVKKRRRTGNTPSPPPRVTDPVPTPPIDADWPDDPAELKKMLAAERFRANINESIIHALTHDQQADERGDHQGKGDPRAWSNRRKTLAVTHARDTFGIDLASALTALRMAKSSYHHTVRVMAEKPADRYGHVRQAIYDAVAVDGRRCGYRKVWHRLRRAGIRVSEKIVRAVMAQDVLTPIRKRSRKLSTYRGENAHQPPNLLLAGSPDFNVDASSRHYRQHAQSDLLSHDFHADVPNQKLVTDVTEFACRDGKLYFSPLIDCFDGYPVAWSMSTSMDASLVTDMLSPALELFDPDHPPIVHSDRGFHYRSNAWLSLTGTGTDTPRVRVSMSRKGTSGDNAVAEGFFGVFKQENFHGRFDHQELTTQQLAAELTRQLDWHINTRLSASLGYITLAEHREQLLTV